MERKYSVKLTKSQAELPFFTVLHHTSIPGFNQSQDTDLKKKNHLRKQIQDPTYFLITWRQPTAPSSPHLLVNTQRSSSIFALDGDNCACWYYQEHMCLSDTDLYKTCRDTLGLKLLISDHACQRIQGPHQQRNTDKLTKPS